MAMSLQEMSLPNSADPAALLSFCIDVLCKRRANAACERYACRTHCRLLGGCTIKTHALESAPPDSEHHDPEPDIDVDINIVRSTPFSPQAGPSHASVDVVQSTPCLLQAAPLDASNLEADVDVIQSTPFLPQAGPSHASNLGVDVNVDAVQPTPFLHQAGSLHAGNLEADVDVQPISCGIVAAMPVHDKPSTSSGSHLPLHPSIPLSTNSPLTTETIHSPQAGPSVFVSDEELVGADIRAERHLPIAHTIGRPEEYQVDPAEHVQHTVTVYAWKDVSFSYVA